MQNFRHLDVWSRSHALARTIHRLARTFSDATDDFKAQLTSAAESIPSNIVEGCGAATNREFARFLDISIKSAFELDYRLELAKDYDYITEAEWRVLFDEVVQIRKMLYGFRRVVLGRDIPERPQKPVRRPHRASRADDKDGKRDANRRRTENELDREQGASSETRPSSEAGADN
jgi:four helix bundle protein